jgi:hypothetical protein
MGKAVTVTNAAQIITFGLLSHGIVAQSIGGGGGNGGFAVSGSLSVGTDAASNSTGGGAGTGQKAGSVTVINSGAISVGTIGPRDSTIAILAQSIGGGGGTGGFAGGVSVSSSNNAINNSTGGNGGSGADANTVNVTNSAALSANGANAGGIVAQSIGGGGGNGGFSLGAAASSAKGVNQGVGGTGGAAGLAMAVEVDNNVGGTIVTKGAFAHGIEAQSIGGGGGNGGFSIGAGLSLNADAKSSVGGGGAGAGSTGGTVTVNNFDTITTDGFGAHGILAESIGGGGGSGGFSVSASVSAGGAALDNSIGGAGAGGGSSMLVTVNNSAKIITKQDSSIGILAESIGGGGGNGAFGISAAGSTANAGSQSVGGSGGSAGTGGEVTVNNHTGGVIMTSGMYSHGIEAQSIGGGGGNGAFSIGAAASLNNDSDSKVGAGVGGSAGNAGIVTVTNDAMIGTGGVGALGIFAQSVGGGGGSGGFAIGASVSASGASLGSTLGGAGGGGGAGNTVKVTNSAEIMTGGASATGIFAQSVGGGGGNGGFSIGAGVSQAKSANSSVGGTGGLGGVGLDVTVTNKSTGLIFTNGAMAYGIQAQSIGGGGGNGGFAIDGTLNLGGDASSTVGAGSGGGGGSSNLVQVFNDGQIVTNGAASIGIFAQSVGGGGGSGGFAGALNVGSGSTVTNTVGGSGAGAGSGGQVMVTNTGLIHTFGDRSIGVLAQSIGGGGGNGGFSLAASGSGGDGSTTSIGGGGGGGGSADLVKVTNSGQIVTEGKLSYGIYAQSVGGGGGNGAISVAGTLASGSGGMVSNVGGGGGNGGNGGVVMVDNTGIIVVKGSGSVGVLAQSIGGGGGSGGFAGALNLTGGGQMANNVGGHGGNGGDSGDVTVKSTGSIQTLSDDSVSVLAQSIGGGGGNSAWAISAQAGGATGASVNVGGSSNGIGGSKGKVIVDISGGVLLTSGALSYGLLAQSIGGGGGNGALSVPDPLSTLGGGITAMVGATGGISGDGNLLTSTNANPTATTGQGAVGLIGQSIGGGGGADGATGDISVGSGIGVLKAVAGGSSTKGGSGAAVEFTNTGDIATNGNMAAGTVVQSIGGGGGNAILAFGVVTGTPLGIELNAGGSEGVVGNGGTVNLPTFSGMVQTSGALAAGLIAQSIGGGGGYVGFTTPTGTSVGANGVSFDVGGTGGAGGAALSVAFNATQQISTTGVGAAGLLGQSIGGGGGFAGFWSGGSQNPAVSTSILGASGGAGGNGGAVNLGAVGSVFTTGTGAIGALAQSIGGGGGIAEAFGVGSSAGLVIGAGAGAHGNGDAVTVTTNIVSTTGNGAHAVVAQSIGGGGGVQMTFNFAGALVTSVVSGGVGGGGGNGGPVNVATNGAIRTTGAGAHGIIAQSVAGGGGIVGGAAFTNTLGLNGPFAGSAGGAGFAGAVTVNAQANVVVTGAASTAIYAQSVNGAGVGGNIGITLGNAVLGTNQFVVGSGDGATTTNAVTFSGGANNTLTSFALLATMAGVNGTAVTGGVGNEAITSFGHMIGSIDLGTGTNSIDNKPYNTNPSLSAGVFDSGVTVNLGGPAAGNLLTNEGLLSPGAFLTVMTTNENGNFLQTAPGSCGGFGVPTSTCGYFGVDLDLKSSTADRLNATGTANVSGAVVVNIGNAGDATPGSNTLTVISAAGGETHPNLVVQAQQTAVAQYSLVYPNATDIDLKYSIDFSPAGLTQNQHSVGNAINAIQTAHVQTFRPIAAAIFYQPTVNVLGATYDSLSGEGVAAVEQTAISANDMFHSSILSQARFWMFDNDRNDPNSLNYHDDTRMSYAEARSNGFPNSVTPARAVSTPRTWRIWTTVNGGDWRYPADTRIGTASTSASGGGFTSGLDYQFDPTLMAGVAIGYGKAWVRILDR